MVIYSQRDKRWAEVSYSAKAPHTETIKSSGCGVTSGAMIVASLTEHKVTPVDIAKISLKNGHRIDGVGTAHSLFYELGKIYNLRCEKSYDIESAISCVKRGGLVICSTNGGENRLFSTGGHLFVMCGEDKKVCEFVDPDNYKGKYDTSYRRVRCYEKDSKVYVRKEEAKRHIAVYYLFERKDKMKNKYSYDNTVNALIELGITTPDNMKYWERALRGEVALKPDYVRSLLDRLIKKIG
ncbi:MAG: hypothetical protein E7411_03395 [Ruminococcaceae bacterium]|nr:hypothetical protein [Oscillospiraceae bacterium]